VFLTNNHHTARPDHRPHSKKAAGRSSYPSNGSTSTCGIKRFLATSENAVKSRFGCAVATYVLIAIVKKELKLDASLYTCLQILSVSISEKTEISCALQPYLHRTDQQTFAEPTESIRHLTGHQ